MSNSRISRKHPRSTNLSGWRTLWPVWTLFTILLVFGVSIFVAGHWADLPHKSDAPVVHLAEGQDVHLESRDLGAGQLHLFETMDSRQKVQFIVERTPGKVVHVAVASCSACYRNRKSHYAKNGVMICGQCKEPMDFQSKGRPVRTDHCALVEVSHTESNGSVVVLTRDVFSQAARIPQ